MHTLGDFIAMGGYGLYVWSAFLISMAMLTVMLATSLRRLRRVERMMKGMRRAPAGRAGE